MRLKVLIVPFFVVMVLIMFIGYIQPDIGLMEAQKAELAKKSDQVANMETVISNVDALNQSLDSQKELKQFVLRYLPKTMDQGRVIDTFNFLASQAGLSVTQMAMKELAKPVAVVDNTTATINPATGMPITESVFKNPEADTYIASVKVRGSYESIKSFFDRVAHTDRFHKINDIAIEIPENAGAAVPGAVADALAPKTGDLLGTFEASFDYFPGRTVQTAVTIPVFRSAQFDFSVAQKELDRITSPVSELEYVPSGKPNPFK